MPVSCAGVPCMRNDTTAMTAKSARKSPNRLTTCAYQTRRITSMRSTSRNVIGTGAVAAAAGVVIAEASGSDVFDRQRRQQLAVRSQQHPADAIPLWIHALIVAQPGGGGAQERGRRHALGRRFVQQTVFF